MANKKINELTTEATIFETGDKLVMDKETSPGVYDTQKIDADKLPSGGGTPAGSDGYVQFNNSSSFGASVKLFWDKALFRLGIGTNTPAAVLDVKAEGSAGLTNPFIVRDSNGNAIIESVDNGKAFIKNNLTIGLATHVANFRLYVTGGNDNQTAIYGKGSKSSGSSYGVWGEADAAAGGISQGVRGTALSPGASNNYGFFASANDGSVNSIGLYTIIAASAGVTPSGHTAGVYSINQTNLGADHYSGLFVNSATVTGADMWGLSSQVDLPDATATGYGLEVIMTGLGTKHAIVTSGGNSGFGTMSPDASAAVEIASTTQGFAPPRMTTTQRGNIPTPIAGLMIYNTTTNKLNVYNGSAWEVITSV